MSQDLVLSIQLQNRRLKQGLALSSLVLAVSLLVAAKPTSTSDKQHFTEIDVERINVVTAAGKVELVIANRDRLPNPVVNGKEGESDRGQKPGLLFYNEAGDECGGLIFDGKLDAEGRPTAGTHFSVDRFGGDQQLALGHYESKGTMETGLTVYDRGLAKDYDPLYQAWKKATEGPAKEALKKRWQEAGGAQTPRLFVGRTRGHSSGVILADAKGKPRIMMLVTPEGQPILNFMDGEGQIIESLPKSKK